MFMGSNTKVYYNSDNHGGSDYWSSQICVKGEVDAYVAGKNGTIGCPAGSNRLTREECETAASAYNMRFRGPTNTPDVMPAGCYRKMNGDFWFNTISKESARASNTLSQNICQATNPEPMPEPAPAPTTPAPMPEGPYVTRGHWSRGCLDETRTLSWDECKEAAAHYEAKFEGTHIDSAPSGCYMFMGSNTKVYYNSDNHGGSDYWSSQICVKGEVDAYVAGKNGTIGCPAGSNRLTREECETAASAYNMRFRGPTNTPDVQPAGCYRKMNGDFWFNIISEESASATGKLSQNVCQTGQM